MFKLLVYYFDDIKMRKYKKKESNVMERCSYQNLKDIGLYRRCLVDTLLLLLQTNKYKKQEHYRY